MAGKIAQIKEELLKQIRRISITITVAVNLLYIAYLLFAYANDIGNKYVNIALAVGTVVFLVAYLIITLILNGSKSKLKSAKKFYKRFKLLTKVFTVGTAIYTLITAAEASKFAMWFAAGNAIFLAIRLVFEFIAITIERKIKSFKENRQRRKEEKANLPKQKIRKAKNINPDDIEVTVDNCYIEE